MQLCVQNGGLYEKFGLEETYRIIRDAGIEAVDYNIDNALTASQIRAGIKTEWYNNGIEGLMKFVAPAKAAMEKYGIKCNQIHAPFPCYTEDPEMDAYVLEATKLTMKAAKALDCHYVVVHEGFPPFERHVSKKEVFDWNIKFYTKLIPSAKENDVIICLENLFSTYNKLGSNKPYAAECADMAEAKKYIETLNEIAGEERFGFCLDLGHANLMGKNIYESIMEIGPYLRVLHVHDNNGESDQHLFPFNGNIFWDDFCNGIRDCGYKGALSFETFNQIKNCPAELAQDEMNLLGSIGRYLVGKIEAK